MKGKNITAIFSKTLVIFLIPIILFSTNFLLLASPRYLEWEYSKEDFPNPEEITVRERSILSRSVLAYIKGITDVSTLEVTDLFTQREISHLNDVKILSSRLFLVRGVAAILFVYLTLFAILSAKKKYSVIKYIFSGSLITLTIAIILFVLVYLNFNIVFASIHKIIFPQRSWSFNPQATLIELYPGKFWVDSAVVFLILTLIESLIICLVSFTIMRRFKRKKVKIDIKTNKEIEG